jgi:hypothetical protein
MKPLSVTLAITTLILSFPAAAAFKCTVDGKTTYQETPCSDDVKTRGAQSVISTQSNRSSSSGGITSGAENKRRDGLIKSDLEPRAREAFNALKGGREMAYRDMLCLRARQLLGHPAMKDSVKNTAADYTKRNVEIDTVKSSSNNSVSFTTLPNKALNNKNNNQSFVHVHFDWESGKPCVTHIEAF